jgi:hypothetical protein
VSRSRSITKGLKVLNLGCGDGTTAERKRKAAQLQKELEELFNSQNKSQDATSIPAIFLRVTVTV